MTEATSVDAYVFKDRLLEGEVVLWSGQPGQGVLFHPSDAFLIPFSVMWGGFAILWEVLVTVQGAPIFFRLWGIPFVLIGLYLIAGRFVHDARVRRDTYYAVTSRRVLMLHRKSTSRFTAMSLDRLPDLSLVERKDGRGTIRFGQPVRSSRGRVSMNADTALDATPKFVVIERPREVFDLIQRAAD